MASKGFIEILRLADLAKARQSGRYNAQKTQWVGVVFEVSGQRLVAPMGEVSEVLSMPDLTTIPLTKPWLLGVANVRGRLLPLTDLTSFLSLPRASVRPSQRKVLVIDQPGFFSGLVIDAVLGIQQFTSAQYRAESLPSDSPLAAYSHGKFVKDEQEWFVFMPSLLVQDQRYVEAAI